MFVTVLPRVGPEAPVLTRAGMVTTKLCAVPVAFWYEVPKASVTFVAVWPTVTPPGSAPPSMVAVAVPNSSTVDGIVSVTAPA